MADGLGRVWRWRFISALTTAAITFCLQNRVVFRNLGSASAKNTRLSHHGACSGIQPGLFRLRGGDGGGDGGGLRDRKGAATAPDPAKQRELKTSEATLNQVASLLDQPTPMLQRRPRQKDILAPFATTGSGYVEPIKSLRDLEREAQISPETIQRVKELLQNSNATRIDFSRRKPEPEDPTAYGTWSFPQILMVTLNESTFVPTFSLMPNRSPLRIDAVIFDLDGTLLDSEMASNMALNGPLLDHFGGNKGVSLTLHAQILGMNPYKALDTILEANNITESMMTREDYIREFHVALEEGYEKTRRMPGALELATELKRRGFKLALCTNSFRKALDKKMTSHQKLKSLFDVIITGDDPEIKRSKPDPSIYLLAARRLGNVTKERCLVFEDSPVGIQAAKAADMHVVAIQDQRFPQPIEPFYPADLLFVSLFEFNASWISGPNETWQRAPQELA